MVPSEAFVPNVSEIAVSDLVSPALAEIQARAGVLLTDWQVRLAIALSCH